MCLKVHDNLIGWRTVFCLSTRQITEEALAVCDKEIMENAKSMKGICDFLCDDKTVAKEAKEFLVKEELSKIKDEAHDIVKNIQEHYEKREGLLFRIERNCLVIMNNCRYASSMTEIEMQPYQNNDMPKKSTRGRGRPQKTIKERMSDDADGKKLARIHKVMGEQTGKDAVLVILVAKKIGWITGNLQYNEFVEEFGNIASMQIFYKYFNGKERFSKRDIEAVEKSLKNPI